MRVTYTHDERYALLGPITLDGEPARVIGAQLDYPMVTTKSGKSVEFSWPTIARAREHGNELHS